MPPKMPKYAEKICDMRILLKYAKMWQIAKYAAITYSRFSDMPNSQCHLHYYKLTSCLSSYLEHNRSELVVTYFRLQINLLLPLAYYYSLFTPHIV